MTFKREEQIDEGGRRTVVTTDRPAYTAANLDREVGEEAIVHTDPGRMFRGVLRTFSLFVLVGLAIVESLLGFRLAFLLIGANPASGFVDFIYDSSNELVEPFGGIVTNEVVDGGGVFESATLIGMMVYLVAAVLLIAVLMAIASFPSRGDERTTRTIHRERIAHEQ